MDISVTFKNFEPSDHLRKYATRRFSKLSRFIPKKAEADLSVVLTVDKFRHKADLTLKVDGQTYSAMEQTDDMYSSVDLVLDKIEAQVKRHAEKALEHRKDAGRQKAHEGGVAHFRRRSKENETILLQDDEVERMPIFPEDAALFLETNKQDLIVFLNAETDTIHVMYRHPDGMISLIDPEEQERL